MTRSSFIVLGSLAAFPLWAQLEPPSLGHLLDRDGHARAVLGIPGAFVLSGAQANELLALACSASLCVGKTATQVVAKDFAAEVGGPALIAVEGDRALLYFQESRQFSILEEGRLTRLSWELPGEIVAVGLTEVAVRDGAQVRVLRPDGAVLRTVEADGPIALLADGVVYTDGGEIIISRDSGEESHYLLADVQSFFRPSSEYLGVRTQSATFLIRLTRGREEMWQLPEAAE